MICLLSPVLLVFAILVKCTSKGPVLFKDKRIGKNGKDIVVWKFRSMFIDAESRLKEYLTDYASNATKETSKNLILKEE